MILFFLLLSTTATIISMDTPKQYLSSSIVIKNKCSINFADQKQAFNDLTKDNACLLKILIAEERRGTHNPVLPQAEQLLHKVYPTALFAVINKTPAIDKDFTEIDSSETKEFVLLIAKRVLHRQLLIEAIDRGDCSSNVLKIIEQNPYVVNAYGKYCGDRMITPLHYLLNKAITNLAEKYSAIRYVDFLLKNGANPNARDDFGNTPMHQASDPELIELLYLHGAKINTKGYGGRTPLFNNIRLCNWPVVQCLLHYNANPNKKDAKGMTPLTKAIAKKEPELVQLLLKYGADWSLEDGKNKGRLVGYTECLRVLRNHIDTHIKDLLVKEFNLMAIHNIMHSPCIHIIETEMLNELMQWIPKHCAEEFQYSNSGAHVLYEHLYEIRKRSLYGTESVSRHW